MVKKRWLIWFKYSQFGELYGGGFMLDGMLVQDLDRFVGAFLCFVSFSAPMSQCGKGLGFVQNLSFFHLRYQPAPS